MRSTLVRPTPSAANAVDEIDVMAGLAQAHELVVHVVVPRQPGVVAYAREAAAQRAVAVSIDLMSETIHVRLDGRSSR
jgi:hypothetical protein